MEDNMEIGMQQDLQIKLYESALEYAKQAGRLVLEHMGNTGRIEQKKNASDLVTEVDRMSEMLLRNQIQQEYPGHWILSEEDSCQANAYEIFKRQKSGYGWIIDPIDGTTNFIHGIPHFSISIGIVKDGKPIIGIVYNPVTNELYTARKSKGAYLNGKLIRVGKELQLAEAVLATGFHANDWNSGSRLVRQIDQIAGKSRNVRIIGAASLDLCWIASGKLTGLWHEGLNPWDTAAGILILTEAGGCVTDKEGNPYRLYHDSLVASNSLIHKEFLETIKL
ncbi:inositol monophosphatase [Collibacillus ludicampi]|uniref:Inositol-1-monophosphatase n=1 Tax=Collibacillus ludicampi TaxID=2771369 RepID=A0AAV4LC30_9BACL|nr:inositol monophosphatase family protein [Collibacillus ludicampi]GIM45370.1 inositol monophosphatase [Collibacillus ludicampi]